MTGGGDCNIKYLRLCSGGFGNELYKEAGRDFAPWKGLNCFSLLHIIDARFRRRRLGPPHKGSIVTHARGTTNTNLCKALSGANPIVTGGYHGGIGQRG